MLRGLIVVVFLLAPVCAQDARTLAPRPANGAESDIVVPAGTRVPLALINSLSTKQSQEGDRAYLESAFPVVIGGRIVIPRGSYVVGTVTRVKDAGRAAGKGELYLRFDTLTLPNGVTRDFRSRLANTDAAATGRVDGEEGRVSGEGNKSGDVRKVGEGAALGASVGSIAGAAAGHIGTGAGIGAAVGGAAGLMAVLLSRGPGVVLPKGTTMEMILDRELRYKSEELKF
ncbi:MAG: TrbI/VirB10 family protein [Acidobacteriia bacterium]|nr:TrbI/VirB10 family protein [Terriglobia bacterium]